MYAEKSGKLVRELKTSKWLPPYNHESISDIKSEIKSLVEKIELDFNSN